MAKQFFRTVTKAQYNVLVYNKETKQVENSVYNDMDNIKPEFLEKRIQRDMPKNKRLIDFEQSERLSFKVVMEMTWNGESPSVTVVSVEPVETEDYEK